MKFITVGAIIAALYLLAKGLMADHIAFVPTKPAPQDVIGNQPMESMTCAIPIAADYLPVGRTIPYSASTSRLGQRLTKVLPLDSQTCQVSTYNAASGLPYGACGTVPMMQSDTTLCSVKDMSCVYGCVPTV